MRAILLLVGVFFTSFVLAEPKQLVCFDRDTNKRADEFQESARKWRDFVNENPDPQFVELAESNQRHADNCRGAPFAWKRVFTFDTDQLKNPDSTDVEEQTSSCHMGSSAVTREQMSHTMSVISFTEVPDRGYGSFNVDRKTLKAGWGTLRDYECKLEDVDTSENLI